MRPKPVKMDNFRTFCLIILHSKNSRHENMCVGYTFPYPSHGHTEMHNSVFLFCCDNAFLDVCHLGHFVFNVC